MGLPWIVCGSVADEGGAPEKTWRGRVATLPERVRIVEAGVEPKEVDEAPAVAMMRIAGPPCAATVGRAGRTEAALRWLGTKIVNPIKSKLVASCKPSLYGILKSNGHFAPESIINPTSADLSVWMDATGLKWPIVIRDAEGSCGEKTFLATNPYEAGNILTGLSKSCARWMACEYFDAKWPDGLYRKWRAYVIGNEVVLWEAGLSRQWIVNTAYSRDFPVNTFKAENALEHWPRHLEPKIVKAGWALGLDVFCLDLAWDQDNRYMVTDCNIGYRYAVPDHLFPPDAQKARADHFGQVAAYLERLTQDAEACE
jgi:glutathione synthase/RimK-type ligase-like ATP-grasp enzyme